MEGWIKIHRKFAEWEWYHKSEMVHLFLHLLLNANHEDKDWRGITIKRGQIVTGLQSLREATGVSIQTIRTCLERLQKTGEINRQSNNHFSIITICKYETYQIGDSEGNKQPNIRLTNDQQATNNKQELKNDKNERNKEIYNPILQKISKYFDPADIAEVSWLETIRLLIENDKYTEDDITKVVVWGRNDDFWKSNFQSILKLRRKNKDGISYMKVLLEKANTKRAINGTQQFAGTKYERMIF